MSATLGWSTMMGWKRRSSAPSFSMYLRYSSSVVAPMHCSSPRASAGLSMFEASIAPSAPPAPTMVCSSSMKITVSLRLADLVHHGLQPLFELAAVLGAGHHRRQIERDDALVLEALRHLAPTTMRCARPSAIAVLPTPGSPISTGLFFLRRDSTWMTRSISFSRPITGSSLPSRASCGEVAAELVQRRRLGALLALALRALEDGVPPSSLSVSSRTRLRSTPSSSSTLAATPSPSRIRPSSRCSVPT